MPAQHECMHHAAAADLYGSVRVAGRGPHPQPVLPGARPDIDVAMGEVLALPGKRPVPVGKRLADEVNGLPVALDVVDGVGIGRRHLSPARFHETELETAAGDHVRGGILFGDAHRLAAQRDKRSEAQDARLARLSREDADEHRVRAKERVDAGVMLRRAYVEAHLVAEEILVDHLLEEICSDPRVAVPIGQAGTHRVGRVEHRLRHVGIGHLAHPPSIHRGISEELASVSSRGTRKRDRRAHPAARTRGDARPRR